MPEMDNALITIIKTAIDREVAAHQMYTDAAQMVEGAHVKGILEDLAAQEVGHRRRLEGLLEGRGMRTISRKQEQRVADLKLTDYLVEEPLDEDSDFQDVLIVAGKREKASHDLYAGLAQVVEGEDAVKLFTFLANEEMTHKNRVESLYEDLVLREN
ncbi:MAG: ferritin family protein [Chloroflexi bacterium]|nr:ferritin family protein [Chloroflexota bacterium]